MLTIYDQNGTVITKDTKKEDIVGNLRTIEINTPPDNKVLNRIDVSTEIHKPIFIDKPKTEVEILSEQIKNSTMLLVLKDNKHDLLIQDLTYKLEKLDLFVKQNVPNK